MSAKEKSKARKLLAFMFRLLAALICALALETIANQYVPLWYRLLVAAVVVVLLADVLWAAYISIRKRHD